MSTEVNLLGMLKRIHQEPDDEAQKKAQQHATFHGKPKDKHVKDEEERAKSSTKPPPNLVVAGIRLPKHMKKEK